MTYSSEHILEAYKKALSAVYLETYWMKQLAQLNRVLLDKIPIAELVNNLPAFYER
jgi:hypothetical protein